MKIFYNNIRELRRHYVEKLSELYPQDEANALIMLLLEQLFNITKVDVALNPNLCLDDLQCEIFVKSMDELLTNRPIQYVIGRAEFCGLEFAVNENVLIPRPETEDLVRLIRDDFRVERQPVVSRLALAKIGCPVAPRLALAKIGCPVVSRLALAKIGCPAAPRLASANDHGYTFNILDIGTGSGCIAISLAKSLNNSYVTALDVSEKALEMAKANAKANAIENVKFVQADILSMPSLEHKYDVIVSNPPYVCESEKTEMRANVLDFEPHTALFVPDSDPLIFYRHITNLAVKALTDVGSLWFEINENLGAETQQLCQNAGFDNVLIINDFREKNRFIKASGLNRP